MKKIYLTVTEKLGKLAIGVRLGMGFGLVMVLLVMVIAVSFATMVGMQQRVDTILQDQYKKVTLATEVKYNVALIHQLLLGAVIAAEYQGENAVGNQIKIVREKNVALMKGFKAALTDPADKTRVAEIVKASVSDEVNEKELFQLLNAGSLTEAKSLLNATIRLSEIEYVKSLSDMVDMQSEKMAQQSKLSSVASSSARLNIMLLGGAAIVLGTLAAFFIVRGLLRQLGGEPAYASWIASRIAEGDLAVEVHTKIGDQDSLLVALKMMRDKLATVVGQVRNGTDRMAITSAEIATGNQDLSARTERQASALQETAASMDELTSTVGQNADNARHANVLAASASEVAVRGGAVVGRVVTTMSSITQASSKITDIIGVIDSIAFQTNILALNAAVEAARAGEQGRGFAVVASEVRNLAQRSSAAAREIKVLIDDSITQVKLGSTLVDEAGVTMTAIVDSVKHVTDIMGEILSASQEQTAGIEQINRAIIEIDGVTQQNAALVEQASGAAESMQDQAANLARMVSVFELSASAQYHTA